MKKVHYYTLPLFGFCVKGEVHTLTQLSGIFQNWCAQHGLSDEESLALWTAGRSLGSQNGFEAEHLEKIALGAIKKLPRQKEGDWLDLTNQ